MCNKIAQIAVARSKSGFLIKHAEPFDKLFPRRKINAFRTLLTLEKLRDSPYSLIVNTPDKHF